MTREDEIVARVRSELPDGIGEGWSRVASAKLGRLAPDSPMWSMEVSRWLMILQIDTVSTAEMAWTDLGIARWLIRREDLAAGALDEATMTGGH